MPANRVIAVHLCAPLNSMSPIVIVDGPCRPVLIFLKCGFKCISAPHRQKKAIDQRR